MTFDQWVTDNRHQIESELIDYGIRFINDRAKDSATVSDFILDDSWHYLDKKSKQGYIGEILTNNKGIPRLNLTFNCFSISYKFDDSYEIVKSLREDFKSGNFQSYIPTKPIAAHVKPDDSADKAQYILKKVNEYQYLPTTPTGNQAGYFLDKQIFEMVDPLSVIRYGDDKNGSFGGVLVTDIDGNPRGVQYFYSKKIPDLGNKKFDWGFKKKGACKILDKLDSDSDILICEGFADGVILHSIINKPVVICLDAGNIYQVLQDIRAKYPNISGTVVCDNDKWKYDKGVDNIGVLKGVLAAKDFGFKYVVPQFKDGATKPTDISDLYLLEGEKRITQLLSHPKKPPVNFNPFKRKYLGKELNSPKAPKKAPKSPQKAPIAPIVPTNKRISDSLVEKLMLDGVRVARFDLEKDSTGKHRIPNRIAEDIKNNGNTLSILSAQMGTGKTHSVIKPLVEQAFRDLDSPTLVSHLILLAKSGAEKNNMHFYSDTKNQDEAQDFDSLSISINGIINPMYQPVLKESRLNIFDEFDACMDSIMSGTVPRKDKLATFNKLISMISKDKALITSADLDDLALSSILNCRPKSEIVLYIANHAKVRENQSLIIHDDYNSLLVEAEQAALNGKKLLIVADSVAMVESLVAKLKKKNITALDITKNTSGNLHDFLGNVNAHVHEYQVVAGTPSIAHGISFDSCWFESVYGVFCGTASNNTFLQMISRDRNTNIPINVAFKANHSTLDDKETEIAIERMGLEAMAAAMQTRNIVINQFGAIESFEQIGGKIEISDFDKMLIGTMIQNTKEKDSKTIVERLLQDGMVVTYKNHLKPDRETNRIINKETLNVYKQEKMSEVLVDGMEQLKGLMDYDIKAIAVEGMEKRGSRTNQEKAAILQISYGTEPTEDIYNFDAGGGKIKISQLEKTLLARDSSIELDKQEIQRLPTSLLKHNRIQQTYNGLLLKAIGLKFDDNCNPINPLGVNFNGKSEKILKLIKLVDKSKDKFNGAMPVKYTPKSLPMFFINNWLTTLGIKVISNRTMATRSYTLNCDWLKIITNPIISRKSEGVDKFLIEASKYDVMPISITPQPASMPVPVAPQPVPIVPQPTPMPVPVPIVPQPASMTNKEQNGLSDRQKILKLFAFFGMKLNADGMNVNAVRTLNELMSIFKLETLHEFFGWGLLKRSEGLGMMHLIFIPEIRKSEIMEMLAA